MLQNNKVNVVKTKQKTKEKTVSCLWATKIMICLMFLLVPYEKSKGDCNKLWAMWSGSLIFQKPWKTMKNNDRTNKDTLAGTVGSFTQRITSESEETSEPGSWLASFLPGQKGKTYLWNYKTR